MSEKDLVLLGLILFVLLGYFFIIYILPKYGIYILSKLFSKKGFIIIIVVIVILAFSNIIDLDFRNTINFGN